MSCIGRLSCLKLHVSALGLCPGWHDCVTRLSEKEEGKYEAQVMASADGDVS